MAEATHKADDGNEPPPKPPAMGEYEGIERKECPTINFQEALSSSSSTAGSIMIDTRTPKEYDEAHALDSTGDQAQHALNFPLLSNAERHEIGKTYHKESKEAAVIRGWELFCPQIPAYLEGFARLREKRLLVYCWRGGMRSRIVVNLLRLNGYDAVQLVGGFKRYNNEIVRRGLEAFETSSAGEGGGYPAKFVVLVGYTGTRKTEILKKLDADRGLPVLDLEGLAGHKGSVYGSVDTVPRSQKMFSILLYHKLEALRRCPYIFVEAESNKIGNVHLPLFMNEKIRDDLKVLVTATVPTRVAAVRREYLTTSDSVRQLHEATKSPSILRLIGKQKVEMLHAMLDDGEYDEFSEYLLVNYYDVRYKHTKAEYSYGIEVESDDIDACCAELTEFYASLLS